MVCACKVEVIMNRISFGVLISFNVVLAACSASGPGIFRKQSPHEQYGERLDAAGLKQTALGIKWFAAATAALQQPAAITIPYRERGYFAAGNPAAIGLRFTAKRGQILLLQLEKKSSAALTLYLELWKLDEGRRSLQQAFDTTQNKFVFEVEENAEFVVRLQPELLGSGEYQLSISIGPSLEFPVAGRQARIGSVWGDDRDAGARRHEGIDIFAAMRTPALASAAGTVSVSESNLGGKVVWLRPAGKRYTLYYAHLAEQLVTSGQRVNVGDTVGLIGNTGNARSTPPHLHFGIYGLEGAVNPLPFVEPGIQKAAEIRADPDFETPVRLNGNLKTAGATRQQNTVAFPVAQTRKGYRVQFPDQTRVELERDRITQGSLRKSTVRSGSDLFERPDSLAPRIRAVATGTAVSVYGIFNDFGYAEVDGVRGWIPLKDIR